MFAFEKIGGQLPAETILAQVDVQHLAAILPWQAVQFTSEVSVRDTECNHIGRLQKVWGEVTIHHIGIIAAE